MPAYRLPSKGALAACMLLMFAAACGWPVEARAAETVRILAAGAAQGAVLRLEPAIAASSTAKLDAVFDTGLPPFLLFLEGLKVGGDAVNNIN